MTNPVNERRGSSDWGSDESALADEARKGRKAPSDSRAAAATATAPKVIEDHAARECRAPDKSEVAPRELAKQAGKPHPSVTAARQAASQKSSHQEMYARSYSDAKGAGIEAGVVKDVRADSEGEFFTVHAKVEDGEGSVGLTGGRVINKGKHGSFGVEGLTVKAELGSKNSDGSRGINASVGATIAGAEGTLKGPNGSSFTAGASLGAGTGGSVGIADANGDGVPEYCFRAEIGALTVGACIPAAPSKESAPARREKVMP